MLTIPQLKTRPKGGAPLVMLTCYTAPMAKLMDGCVDMLLVGDSLGMTIYGMKNTLGVTLEMMINHGRAVVEHAPGTAVIIDMPFGSYEASPAQAFLSASRLMQETGALAVKLEGGQTMAETVRFLSDRGIPVMGHVGLTPQSIQQLDGFKVQGKNSDSFEKILKDAQALEEAGAFAVVIECVPEPLAALITEKLSIPVIGIGASPQCDGQVLVVDDMLGFFTDFRPKFVRHYAALHTDIKDAIEQFASDVRDRQFPSSEECYK